MEYKKSAIDLTELAVGIVVLGIVVSIGATILVAVRDSTLTSLSEITTTNESVTMTEVATNLDVPYYTGLTSLTNVSNGTAVPAAEYTVALNADTGLGQVTYVSGSYNNTPVNAIYSSYNLSNTEYDLPNQAAIGLGEYGNWFTILVIVGIAAVVLSLIFLAFGNRGSGDSGSGVTF